MIYSSGRESFFNLNSTWYDPAGSWLDTRRTPFRYGYNNCCSSGCEGEGVEGMRGHDYRCYGYRQPVCSERCQGYAGANSCHGGGSSCVRRPTYSYGSSGGCNSYGRSVCSERCHGSSGSCHGGSSSRVRRPTYSYGSSGGCHGYGRSVCSETCHGSGYPRGKPVQRVSQCCPVQTSPAPVQTLQQGCMPVAKRIPSQQPQQVCKVPARKIK
ncbi:PREDICTED: loricrin-like [Buceros rhinoceros silvestris]|uniref:loricrin-like n=1 Tax=Buceros rhinoceros silvestris TaxID=175836 RepID=UPI000528DBD5|nr:PREDICTED: loricrin-like [Buceros rhinoceros silvestris]